MALPVVDQMREDDTRRAVTCGRVCLKPEHEADLWSWLLLACHLT